MEIGGLWEAAETQLPPAMHFLRRTLFGFMWVVFYLNWAISHVETSNIHPCFLLTWDFFNWRRFIPVCNYCFVPPFSHFTRYPPPWSFNSYCYYSASLIVASSQARTGRFLSPVAARLTDLTTPFPRISHAIDGRRSLWKLKKTVKKTIFATATAILNNKLLSNKGSY